MSHFKVPSTKLALFKVALSWSLVPSVQNAVMRTLLFYPCTSHLCFEARLVSMDLIIHTIHYSATQKIYLFTASGLGSLKFSHLYLKHEHKKLSDIAVISITSYGYFPFRYMAI